MPGRSVPTDNRPRFVRPVDGPLTGTYAEVRGGRIHGALDIGVPTGTPVRCSAPGKVTSAGFNNGGYGNLVTVDHGGGWETYYAHNSELKVQTGQQVTTGQVLALAGSTGNSTGPHVHWEIRRNGEKVDPAQYEGGNFSGLPIPPIILPPIGLPGEGPIGDLPGVVVEGATNAMDALETLRTVMEKLADGKLWFRILGVAIGVQALVVGVLIIKRDTVVDIGAMAATGGGSKAAKVATTAAAVTQS